MTTQFVQIGRQIVNLQLITNAVHIPQIAGNKPYTAIYFNHGSPSILLEDEEAIVFWRALQKSSLNLRQQSPQLPPLNHAQQSV